MNVNKAAYTPLILLLHQYICTPQFVLATTLFFEVRLDPNHYPQCTYLSSIDSSHLGWCPRRITNCLRCNGHIHLLVGPQYRGCRTA